MKVPSGKRLRILQLLTKGEMTGRDLVQADPKTFGYGMIYTTMHRMEDDGLVSSRIVETGEPGSAPRYYRLTGLGQRMLALGNETAAVSTKRRRSGPVITRFLTRILSLCLLACTWWQPSVAQEPEVGRFEYHDDKRVGQTDYQPVKGRWATPLWYDAGTKNSGSLHPGFNAGFKDRGYDAGWTFADDRTHSTQIQPKFIPDFEAYPLEAYPLEPDGEFCAPYGPSNCLPNEKAGSAWGVGHTIGSILFMLWLAAVYSAWRLGLIGRPLLIWALFIGSERGLRQFGDLLSDYRAAKRAALCAGDRSALLRERLGLLRDVSLLTLSCGGEQLQRAITSITRQSNAG